MSSSQTPLLLLSIFLILHRPLFSAANLHRINFLRPYILTHQTPHNETPSTVFFEVTKPIKVPKTKPCSHLVLHHDFAYTYGKAPVFANYSPPKNCPSQDFSKIVLEWKAACKGRQFDRIFGVWLGGVELLRSCTAEPTASGIVWSVEKDITKYHSLLLKNQTLAVYLGNLLDATYTGIYHVNLTFHFYPASGNFNNYVKNGDDLGSAYHPWADLVLPISRNLPLKDGLWFRIENSTDSALKEFKIPKNVYRAVLEVYVSFHENDESWYSNLPNDYIVANNITDLPGNGPFREVVVSLDSETVGAVWPFTVIFTGGVNPLLWRPITSIGSFNLPSYDIEITPLLGKILDGKFHDISFRVTNALNVWLVDANLHLWLDRKCAKTLGRLYKHTASPLAVSLESNFSGPNGTFSTVVGRSVMSTGWVKSSYGNITTQSVQHLYYSNLMVLGSRGDMQIVNQTIHFNHSVHAKMPSSSSSNGYSSRSNKAFSIYLSSNISGLGNGTSFYIANLTLGFKENKCKGAGFGILQSSLNNVQNGQGYMVVKNNLVASGLGSTKQEYKYDGEHFCYFRNISSSNYTILYDKVGSTCQKQMHSGLSYR